MSHVRRFFIRDSGVQVDPAETVFEAAVLDEFSISSQEKAHMREAIAEMKRELSAIRLLLQAQKDRAAWAWVYVVLPIAAMTVSLIAAFYRK